MVKKVVTIQCECDDWVAYETMISQTQPFTCPNCGRIYTYEGDILEPITDGDEQPPS